MEIRFALDVYNPAEYYAALGLLELASRQDGDVMSCFETNDTTSTSSTFMMTADKEGVLPDLKLLEVTAQQFIEPLIAPVNVADLEVNWWTNYYKDAKGSRKNNRLAFWAGLSCPVDMLKGFQKVMGEMGSAILQHSVKVRAGKSSFGFDTRASRDALAVGYSQKEADEPSVIYPETEFLCAIGLQNFRPMTNDSYFVWKRPAPISIAHAAAVAEVAGLRQSRYTMAVAFVGQGLRAVSQVAKG